MVLLHVKRPPKDEYSKDYDEFLVPFPNTANVGEVTEICTKIQNLRIRIKWMALAAKEIAKDSVPEEDNKQVLMGPVQQAETFLNLERTTVGKMPCTVEECLELCATFKGAAMMLFPGECSGKDCLSKLGAELDSEHIPEPRRALVHRLLSIIDDGAVTEDILQGPTSLWWCGKQMMKDQELKAYSGKNDKTKLIVKITKEGGQAPLREPGLDLKTQQEMMAYWYKKQEEDKKLITDDDISYGNSEWADSQGLKKNLSGINGGIKFR